MASVMLEGDLDQLSLHSILWGVVKFKKLQYCTLQQRERARGGMLKLAQILTSGAERVQSAWKQGVVKPEELAVFFGG